jgi:hypothetical protein
VIHDDGEYQTPFGEPSLCDLWCDVRQSTKILSNHITFINYRQGIRGVRYFVVLTFL